MLSAYAKAVGRIIAIEGIKNFELEEGNSIEYELAEVMEICFADDNVSKEEIKKLFISLRDFPTVRNKYKGSYFKSLMYPVAGLYVEDFLDIIVGDEKGPYELEREIKGGNGISTNIIDNLNPEHVFLWADNSKRRLRVVKLSSGFRREENGQYQWTELARKLLHTEDGKQILEQFAKKIPPMSWSGSRSKIIRERLTLLQELKSDEYLGEIACREIEKMEIILPCLRERLKPLRKAKKVKQREMAELLGCTRQHNQKIEYGVINIPTTTLIFLADFFDVSADYLLGREKT